MFKVTLTKFIDGKTEIYEGWFTAREIKKSISGWLSEYAAVRMTPAKLGVLDLAHDE